MKKIIMCLCLLVFGVVLTSCGNDFVDPVDYSIDKEIKLKKEVTMEELKEVEVSIEDIKNFTMEMNVERNELADFETNILLSFTTKNNKINGNMKLETGITDLELYIKDSYMCLDFGMLGKFKTLITDVDDFTSEEIFSEEFDFEEVLKSFIEEYESKESDNLKMGYDKDGCLVIDYKDENVTFRYVLNKYLPVYLYMSSDDVVAEIKCSYDKVKVEYPEGFDIEDYKTVESFDDIL